MLVTFKVGNVATIDASRHEGSYVVVFVVSNVYESLKIIWSGPVFFFSSFLLFRFRFASVMLVNVYAMDIA